jgi:hypothetical protein
VPADCYSVEQHRIKISIAVFRQPVLYLSAKFLRVYSGSRGENELIAKLMASTELSTLLDGQESIAAQSFKELPAEAFVIPNRAERSGKFCWRFFPLLCIKA